MAKYDSHRKVELVAEGHRLTGPGSSQRESPDQAEQE